MQARAQPYQLNQAGDAHAGLFEDVQTRDNLTVRIGQSAGKFSTGAYNVFGGYEAGKESTKATYGTYLGYQAGYYAGPTANGNTYVGALCGRGYGPGVKAQETVGVGFGCLEACKDQIQSVYIGTFSGREAMSTYRSVAIGYRASERTQDGDENVYCGAEAAQDARSGSRNCALGFRSFRANFRGGSENVAVGAYSGYSNFGSGNTYVGFRCGENGSPEDASFNTALGAFALNNIGGGMNCVIGYAAQGSGFSNTAIGMSAAAEGDAHCIMGTSALTKGYGNTVIGSGTSLFSGAACNTVTIGQSSFLYGGGEGNVIIGAEAGPFVIGNYNTVVAFRGADNLQNGQSNVLIGVGADVLSKQTSGSIAIGPFRVFGEDNTISMGQNVTNKRSHSTLIGYDLQSDAGNTIIIGNDIVIKSTIFLRDPLNRSFQDTVRNEAANKFGISNIDYGTLLVSPLGTIYNEARIGRFTSNIVNSTRFTRKNNVSPSSYSLLQPGLIPSYIIYQGLTIPITDDSSPLVMRMEPFLGYLDLRPSSNIASTVTCNVPDYQTFDTLKCHEWTIDLEWGSTATANILAFGASNARVPFYIPKQSKAPYVTLSSNSYMYTITLDEAPLDGHRIHSIPPDPLILSQFDTRFTTIGISSNSDDLLLFFVSKPPKKGILNRGVYNPSIDGTLALDYMTVHQFAFDPDDSFTLTPVLQKKDADGFIYGILGSNSLDVQIKYSKENILTPSEVYLLPHQQEWNLSNLSRITPTSGPCNVNIYSLSPTLTINSNGYMYSADDVALMDSSNVYDYPAEDFASNILSLRESGWSVLSSFQESAASSFEPLFINIQTSLYSMSTSTYVEGDGLLSLQVLIDKGSNVLATLHDWIIDANGSNIFTALASDFDQWSSLYGTPLIEVEAEVQTVSDYILSFSNMYIASGLYETIVGFQQYLSIIGETDTFVLGDPTDLETTISEHQIESEHQTSLQLELNSEIMETIATFRLLKSVYFELPRLFLTTDDLISGSTTLLFLPSDTVEPDTNYEGNITGKIGTRMVSVDFVRPKISPQEVRASISCNISFSADNLFPSLPLNGYGPGTSNLMRVFPQDGSVAALTTGSGPMYTLTKPFSLLRTDPLSYITFSNTEATAANLAINDVTIIKQPTYLTTPISVFVPSYSETLLSSTIDVTSESVVQSERCNILYKSSYTSNTVTYISAGGDGVGSEDALEIITSESSSSDVVIAPIIDYEIYRYQQVAYETTEVQSQTVVFLNSYDATSSLLQKHLITSNVIITYDITGEEVLGSPVISIGVTEDSSEVEVDGVFNSNVQEIRLITTVQSNIPIISSNIDVYDDLLLSFTIMEPLGSAIYTSNLTVALGQSNVHTFISDSPFEVSTTRTMSVYSNIALWQPMARLAPHNLYLAAAADGSHTVTDDDIIFELSSAPSLAEALALHEGPIDTFSQSDVRQGTVFIRVTPPSYGYGQSNTILRLMTSSFDEIANIPCTFHSIDPMSPIIPLPNKSIIMPSGSYLHPLNTIISLDIDGLDVSDLQLLLIRSESGLCWVRDENKLTKEAPLIDPNASVTYYFPPFTRSDTVRFAVTSNEAVVSIFEQNITVTRRPQFDGFGFTLNTGVDYLISTPDAKQFEGGDVELLYTVDHGEIDSDIMLLKDGIEVIEFTSSDIINRQLQVRTRSSNIYDIYDGASGDPIKQINVILHISENEGSSPSPPSHSPFPLYTTTLPIYAYHHNTYPCPLADSSFIQFKRFGDAPHSSNILTGPLWDAIGNLNVGGNRIQESSISITLFNGPDHGILWSHEEPTNVVSRIPLPSLKQHMIEGIPYLAESNVNDGIFVSIETVNSGDGPLRALLSPPFLLGLKNYIATYSAGNYDPTQPSPIVRTQAPPPLSTVSQGLIQDGYSWVFGFGSNVLPYDGTYDSKEPIMVNIAMSNIETEVDLTMGRQYMSFDAVAKTTAVLHWTQATVPVSVPESGQLPLKLDHLIEYDADSASTVFVYVSQPPRFGLIMDKENGAPLARFTIDAMRQSNVVYQHLGESIEQDFIKLLVSSHPYDLNPEPCTLQISILRLPRIIDNSVDYAFYDTKERALSEARSLSRTLVVDAASSNILPSSYVHVLSRSNIEIDINTDHDQSHDAYVFALSYLVNSNVGYRITDLGSDELTVPSPPYNPLQMRFTINRDPDVINSLALHPVYQELFTYNWSGLLNTVEEINIEPVTLPDLQGMMYTFDENSPAFSNLFERTVSISFRVQPTSHLQRQPDEEDAELQMQRLRTFEFMVEGRDDRSSNIFKIIVNQTSTRLYTSDRSREKPTPGVRFGSFQTFSLVNSDPDNGAFTSIYLGYDPLGSYEENAPKNILLNDDIRLDFDRLRELHVYSDTSSPSNLYISRIEDVARKGETREGEDDTYLKVVYNFASAGTIMQLKDLEIAASTYTFSNVSSIDEGLIHNIVLGKDILVRGVNNICVGNNFSTSGLKSIIIGNDIGVVTDSTVSTFNDIYQCIVIGNDSFKQSIIRDVICIGNENLNDLFLTPVEQVSTFLSKKPIMIGNNIDRSMVDYHINIGNSFLKTGLGGDKILLGISNEAVGVGFSNHAQFENSVANFHINGGFQSEFVYPFRGCHLALMETIIAQALDGSDLIVESSGLIVDDMMVIHVCQTERSKRVYGMVNRIIGPYQNNSLYTLVLVTTAGDTHAWISLVLAEGAGTDVGADAGGGTDLTGILGEYIVSSTTPGVGQLQDDDIYRGSTIAKVLAIAPSSVEGSVHSAHTRIYCRLMG